MRSVLGSNASIGGVLGSGRGAAATADWWLSGGVSAANAIAVYQPIGAASLAASYTNLANPGTYDATVVAVAPTWNATNGWIRTGSSGALDSGVTPTSSAWSMIMRFSNYSASPNYRYIGRTVTGRNFAFALEEPTNQFGYYNSGGLLKSGTLSTGTLAIAGQTGYKNGVSQGAIPAAWTGSVTGSIYLLTCFGLTAINVPTQIYVQSFAIYDTTLSAGQVAAISSAMSALTG